MATLNSIRAIAILAALSLTACGGGSGNTTTPTSSSAPPQSPGGIWTGTDSSTGMQVTALVSESGQMQVIRSDRAQFFGDLAVIGGSITSNIDGIAAFGTTFPDGSTHGIGKVSGTLTERASLQATVSFTTDKGESTSSNVSLTFQSVYLNTPNVANFAGTYTDSLTGVTVSITSGGAIFAQDPNTGCVVNGQVNVVQANYNLWAASIDYANCQGSAAALSGLEFAGFVELNGNQILAGFQDKSGKNYGLVFSLSKT